MTETEKGHPHTFHLGPKHPLGFDFSRIPEERAFLKRVRTIWPKANLEDLVCEPNPFQGELSIGPHGFYVIRICPRDEYFERYRSQLPPTTIG